MNAETITMTGAQLKQQREDCGLTQPQLAACVGKSRSALAHWESGRTAIPADVVPRLRAIFGAAVGRVDAFRRLRRKLAEAHNECDAMRVRMSGTGEAVRQLTAELAAARGALRTAQAANIATLQERERQYREALREMREKWSTNARAQFDETPSVEDCMHTLVKLTCKRVAEWVEGQAVPVSQMWEAYKLLAAAEG